MYWSYQHKNKKTQHCKETETEFSPITQKEKQMAEKANVLVATDMSDWAKKAEVRGAVIAKELGGKQFTLSYVQEKAETDVFLKLVSGISDFGEDEVVKKVKDRLQKRADVLAAEQNITVNPVVRTGEIAEETQVVLKTSNADLLVMGKHGHGYHSVPIIGNTPVKIIQGSPCPVLVVRNNPEHPYKRVLIPVEFTEAGAYQIQKALPFIPADAEITLINVCMPPTQMHQHFVAVSLEMIERFKKRISEEAQNDMKKFVDGLNLDRPVKTVIKVGLPHHTILDYVTTENIDLLVLGKKPRNRLAEYLVGSMVHTGLNEAECDVMVTPSLK